MYKESYTYREECGKQSYMCLQSHISCAGLSGPRVGGGHHQLVCSPAGHTVGDMNGWN